MPAALWRPIPSVQLALALVARRTGVAARRATTPRPARGARRRVAFLAAVGFAVSAMSGRAGEVRLDGDLNRYVAWPRDIAATPDGGWGALFTVSSVLGQYDEAIVLRADAADSLSWALRIPGRAPGALASLPDGGLLLAGDRGWPGDRGWLARLSPDGSQLWQVELAPGEHVLALACNGWSCAFGSGERTSQGFVAGIDALSGVVTFSHALPNQAKVTFMALRSDGLLAAGMMLNRSCCFGPDAVVAVFDASGNVAWSTVLAVSEEDTVWDQPAVTGLAWLADGSLLAVGEDEYGSGRAIIAAADGSPLAVHLVGGASFGDDFVELASGDLLFLHGSHQVRTSPRLLPLQSIALADPAGGGHLAASPTGDLLELGWGLVLRLRADLTAPETCPSLLAASLPERPPTGGVMVDAGLSLVANAGPGVSPSFDVAQPVCLGTPCLIPCEQDCFNGLDDDDDGATDCDDLNCSFTPGCEAADSDGDGIANAMDCRPDIGSAFALPGPVLDLRVGRNRGWQVIPVLTWSDVRVAGSGTTAEVVRGRLADLHADRSGIRGTCLIPWGAAPFGDVGAAWESASLWYLVRAANACGAGPWEGAGLDAAGRACP